MNIYFNINANSGIPLYQQIADEVKAAFLRGYIQSGERLPSIRELASNLGINPTTIVKAYDLLEHERLIIRRHGQGAYVSDGNQPLHAKEKKELITQLARQLAIEGRRLNLTEEEINTTLENELEKIRPQKGD